MEEMDRSNVEYDQVKMPDLDYSDAPTLQAKGFRFIIPVPDLGEESIEHTVKNWKGEDEVIKGYKFRNAADTADQAVDGNGTGVIVVGVDPEVVDGAEAANLIMEKVEELGGLDSLNTEKLNQLMDYIHNEIGLTDTYNSTDKIADNLEGQDGLSTPKESRPFGYYEKSEKPGPVGVFVNRKAQVLDGPHAGTATYEDGFLAVQIPPKKEGEEPTYRSVARSAIHYCYKLADGTEISDPESDLPLA